MDRFECFMIDKPVNLTRGGQCPNSSKPESMRQGEIDLVGVESHPNPRAAHTECETFPLSEVKRKRGRERRINARLIPVIWTTNSRFARVPAKISVRACERHPSGEYSPWIGSA